tara:strand:+ start:2740 stop:3021 length:282 start_codon:yes stop_codon:yes gene_type:complete
MQTQTNWKFDWKATANALIAQEDLMQTVDYLVADGQLTWLLANDADEQREQMKYCRALYKELIGFMTEAKLGMSLFNSQELGGRAVTITAQFN